MQSPATRPRPASRCQCADRHTRGLPTEPSHEASSMLAIIGGTGLTRLSTLAVAHREVIRTPYGEPSRRCVFGEIAGHRRDLPRTARARPHDTAAPRQLSRQFMGAEGAGRERRAGRRFGGRHPRLRARRPRPAAPADRLHVAGARRRSSTAATSRSSTSTSRIRIRTRCARSCLAGRAARQHRAAATAASTARYPARGSRRRRRSTGWIAMARRWSG